MPRVKVDYWLTDEGLEKIAAWARRGLTEEQIAHNCGVDRRTLTRWKKKYVAICRTLTQAKDVADRAVENALYKRAVGYKVTETTRYRDKETGEMVVAKEITKEIAPDPTSMVFWLKNRMPEHWKDRPEQKTDSTESQIASFMDALNDAVTDKKGGDNSGA